MTAADDLIERTVIARGLPRSIQDPLALARVAATVTSVTVLSTRKAGPVRTGPASAEGQANDRSAA